MVTAVDCAAQGRLWPGADLRSRAEIEHSASPHSSKLVGNKLLHMPRNTQAHHQTCLRSQHCAADVKSAALPLQNCAVSARSTMAVHLNCCSTHGHHARGASSTHMCMPCSACLTSRGTIKQCKEVKRGTAPFFYCIKIEASSARDASCTNRQTVASPRKKE